MKKHKLNIIAPLSVATVVITLGAAFGVLSGRGAFIGMVSTCVITLITALFSGSKYGISSPTGPMTAAIAVILSLDTKWLQTHTSSLDPIALMNLTLLFAGIFLLILNFAKIHKVIKLIPNLVISGFVNGIALLIVISQFQSISSKADWALMFATFVLSVSASKLYKNIDHIAYKIITSSFFIIVIMSILATLTSMPVSFLDVATSNNIQLSLPHIEGINFETIKIITPLAFELAIIALIDTMLTSVIIDKKSKTKTKLTRELTGQSISLLGVSLFGGIPGAQSTVPSIMMLQEGGNHKAAKILLAVFCIAFTFLFANLLQFVPLAVFGGLILKIAFDVADFTSLKSLIKCPKKQRPIRFAIIFGTCLSTVMISLNLAVISFTLGFILWNNFVPKKFQIPDLQNETEFEGLADEI